VGLGRDSPVCSVELARCALDQRPWYSYAAQRTGDALHYLLRDAASISTFRPDVVLDRDTGEQHHLLPTKPRHPPLATVARQPGLPGSDPSSPSGQELANLATDAGDKHWHGATPTTLMTHITVEEQLNRKMVDWMARVTDEQYWGEA
jgi:hypothetical protein